jgi:molybdopterin-containing oxidoreductase family membrane subunit
MSIIVNIGMWFERFVIIVTSLHRDYIPSSWTYYRPTITEIGIFLGTFGLFFTCYFLFCKFLPSISIAETKAIMPIDQLPIAKERMKKEGHSHH